MKTKQKGWKCMDNLVGIFREGNDIVFDIKVKDLSTQELDEVQQCLIEALCFVNEKIRNR